MVKTVNALRARKNLGELLEEVYYRGEEFVIERAGKPMAAVVPLSRLRGWKETRDRVFGMVEKVWKRNRSVPLSTIEREVAEAIREVRAKSTRRRR
ncbi:MAG TPA: type II toxin-antitoxin system prevent-host-death family antitoxin [Planctomycetota bacterium]|nr:type II toxin-antitoxin system prevent-host-death family antitoxin [Planctomycetota bacterium]